jgi:hypothetical protein
MGRCTLSYHGGDAMVSPFLHKSLPGYNLEVAEQDLGENDAYKVCWPLSLDRWHVTEADPSGYRVEGHAMLRNWGQDGSYGVGGSRGCMRSCFDHLERKGEIGQSFEGGPFIRRPRWLLPAKVERRKET